MTARYLTPEQLAADWGCSGVFIRRLARNGRIVAFRTGRRWRISAEAAEAYKRRNTPAQKAEERTVAAQPSRRPASLPDGPYAAVVKGDVPWRDAVGASTARGRGR